jgi:transcriptional regulator with XRE-family HTH domain
MDKQQPAIARLENANVQPSIAFLQQVADALDLRLVVRLEPKTAVEAASGAESIANVHESAEPVREKATA